MAAWEQGCWLQAPACGLGALCALVPAASLQYSSRDWAPGRCRYNDDFDGVILAVDNERIITQRAHVHPYFPLVRVDVEADVLLFKPRVGMRLGAPCADPPAAAATWRPCSLAGAIGLGAGGGGCLYVGGRPAD